MAISLGKKQQAAKKASPAQVVQAGVANLFLSGSAASAEVKKREELAAKAAKDFSEKKPYRFWLAPGKSTRVTFLSGNLTEEGVAGDIDVPCAYEHNMQINGDWRNWFVCLSAQEPCPLCQNGDKPYFVGLFLVVDHTAYNDSKGVLQKDTIKIFAAKSETYNLLRAQATKRGGLVGATYDVTRPSDPKSAAVGTQFDFEGKVEDPAKLTELYPAIGVVLHYLENPTKLFTLYTVEELTSLGFGNKPVGSESLYSD